MVVSLASTTQLFLTATSDDFLLSGLEHAVLNVTKANPSVFDAQHTKPYAMGTKSKSMIIHDPGLFFPDFKAHPTSRLRLSLLECPFALRWNPGISTPSATI
jgi:hypothetical protein